MYFFKKYKNRMMVTAVAIILIIIMGITNKERLNITKFEKVVGNIFSPINKITYSIGNKVSGFFGVFSNLSNLLEENEELKLKVISLEEENRDLVNVLGKYDFLKSEAALIESTKYDLVSAQITSKGPRNWYNIFNIDKGLKDGIKKNSNVIQGIETDNGIIKEGLIGRIIDVSDNWSKVVSIVDEQNKLSFKIIRTQDGGILSGSVDGIISGYLFDTEADVVPGDKVYTSGLGETFIEDLYIGEVAEVQDIEEEMMKKIIIKPAINFKKLFKVFIIVD